MRQDLPLSTHEVRIAAPGFSLPPVLPHCSVSGILRFPSFDDPTAQTGYVRVTSCLDAIHHDIDNGPSCFAGDFRASRVRGQGDVELQPDPDGFSRVVPVC
jgi:hypothetical protein